MEWTPEDWGLTCLLVVCGFSFLVSRETDSAQALSRRMRRFVSLQPSIQQFHTSHAAKLDLFPGVSTSG